jgi:hypothetical protein
MPPPSIASVVKAILTADPKLTADAVIRKARGRGLKAAPESIRNAVYNARSDINKAVKPAAVTVVKPAKQAPAAARQTSAPKPVPAPKPTNTSPPPAGADLAMVFANVALVNEVVGASGGVENSRKVAEAVRACGGVDVFLKHLDLVAGIRAGEPVA